MRTSKTYLRLLARAGHQTAIGAGVERAMENTEIWIGILGVSLLLLCMSGCKHVCGE